MTIDIKIVDTYDDSVFKDLVKRNLEDAGHFIAGNDFRTEGDPSFKTVTKVIRIAAFDGQKMIGLSWGQSTSKSRFMMHMSLVEPAYRGQGIYHKMLALMLEKTVAYDEVDSWHHVFNNNIIAIKLRQGFHIMALDHSLEVGPRVYLRYFNNKKIFELMKFRVGLRDDPRPLFK